MDVQSKRFVREVLSIPTAPFYEDAISFFVRWYSFALGLDVEEDRFGNILVTHRASQARPTVTFTAHMDHPGLEVVAAGNAAAAVAVLGGIKPKTLAGARVVIQSSDRAVRGRLGKRPLKRKHLKMPCYKLFVKGGCVARGDFGYLDLPAIKFRSGLMHVRAADDVMNVAAILDFMTRAVARRMRVTVCGLFTRAEEVGLIGASGVVASGLAPKSTPIVTLECSPAKAGNVKISGGPVVRVGDKMSTFTPAVEMWLHDVAKKLCKSSRKFSFQRALMQGGTCESSVYCAKGYASGGIALPLGNYHNNGPRSAACEIISESDYANLLEFMQAIAKNPMQKEVVARRAIPITKAFSRHKARLGHL